VTSSASTRWAVASTGRKGELWAAGDGFVWRKDGAGWAAVAAPPEAMVFSDVWSDGERTWLLGFDQRSQPMVWRREGNGWRSWSLAFAMPDWLGGAVTGPSRRVLLHTGQGILRLPE
jgi:hypothetical protein